MPLWEAPVVELGSAPQTPSAAASPSPSEVSSVSSLEPQNIQATALFRALAMPPPDPEQPPGQDELERRLPGYRRIVIPRELTLIELLKQCSGVTTDEEVLRITEAKLRVVSERVGLRRLDVLAPRLRSLTLDGSALSSLRDLGIGLVHLKTLSVNRCGLTCLDGAWGLAALRALSAAGNRLRDLHPLGALQKLQTLNLADNAALETNRLWTLGVCSSLRRLTLSGTAISDYPDYRTQVAAALPMLVALDDLPLHEDLQDESDGMVGEASSASSDSEVEELPLDAAAQLEAAKMEPESAATSRIQPIPTQNPASNEAATPVTTTVTRHQRHRPSTTEGVGARPQAPRLPPRPRTAQDRPTIDASTRLQILNTLMDEEWRCSGSKLTSQEAVCGNLARALRRPVSAAVCRLEPEIEAADGILERNVMEATRAVAAEIPRTPLLEDWAKFRRDTGIDIHIDFNERPKGDPQAAIEYLERIERETSDNFSREKTAESTTTPAPAPTRFGCSMTLMSDYDQWSEMNVPAMPYPRDLATLFSDISLNRSGEGSVRSNDE